MTCWAASPSRFGSSGRITATSARFEQAFSSDSGNSWQTNWIITMTTANA